MQSRWARVGRGAVGAAVATLVAALSHTIAGGVPPSWFGVGVTFVLAASAGSVLAGRSVSWWRLTASVALGQAMFHLLFAGMGTPTPAAHDHGATLAALAPHDHGMVWAHVIAGCAHDRGAALRRGGVLGRGGRVALRRAPHPHRGATGAGAASSRRRIPVLCARWVSPGRLRAALPRSRSLSPSDRTRTESNTIMHRILAVGALCAAAVLSRLCPLPRTASSSHPPPRRTRPSPPSPPSSRSP